MNEAIKNGMTDAQRTTIAHHLNQLLADEFVLFVTTLNFHWNTTGPFFGQLHLLLNDHYEALLKMIDTIAERIRALGHVSKATLQEFASTASIKQSPSSFLADVDMIHELVTMHETIIRQLRTINDQATQSNDAGTSNLVSGLLETHEKMAWMLRSHLQ